jgi:hypothetical protein
MMPEEQRSKLRDTYLFKYEVEKLDPTKSVLCQVVGRDGKAWNCDFKLTPAGIAVGDSVLHCHVLTVSHVSLTTLPDEHTLKLAELGALIDTCDFGHKFVKLPSHPMRYGKPRCPNCMASGLNRYRGENAD